LVRKIITYFLYLTGICAFGAYIRFCGILSAKAADEEICRDLRITILDSTLNRFVTAASVRELICSRESPLGKKISEIDIHALEERITGSGAIRSSEIAVDRSGIMYVEILQRRPILRLECGSISAYLDETGYRFPLSALFSSYVPIVTGNIPENDRQWDDGIVKMGNYLSIHRFWNDQIEQINVERNGCLTLFTRIGDQQIIFGRPEKTDYKFRKLYSYYRNIAPRYGWNYYETVDLRYSDQIVCRKRKQ